MTGVIVYKSKYGASRQYAEWLSEELLLPALSPGIVTPGKLDDYKFLLIGGPVYIGKIKIRRWLVKNQQSLKNKKLFFFIVCATPSYRKEKLQQIADANIPAMLKKQSRVFFLHGRLNFKKLSWLDKLLLKTGAKLVKDPEEKKAMVTDFDDVKKENIRELVQEVRAWLYGKEEPAETTHIK